jgi:hypothetical protein
MRCSWLVTFPIWLTGDRAEAIAGALLAPLCDPMAWQASMGYPEALGLLAGVLVALLVAWRWPPPGRATRFSRVATIRTAFPTPTKSRPEFPENTR